MISVGHLSGQAGTFASHLAGNVGTAILLLADTVGSETDYNAILKFFHEVKPSYPGCFVIALKDGKRMDLNEAIKATKK